MSDTSDTSDGPLSDWALVDPDGELEDSETSSTTSSVEVLDEDGQGSLQGASAIGESPLKFVLRLPKKNEVEDTDDDPPSQETDLESATSSLLFGASLSGTSGTAATSSLAMTSLSEADSTSGISSLNSPLTPTDEDQTPKNSPSILPTEMKALVGTEASERAESPATADLFGPSSTTATSLNDQDMIEGAETKVSGTAQRQISQEELDALCQTLDDIRGKYVKDLSLRSSRELFGDGTDEPDSSTKEDNMAEVVSPGSSLCSECSFLSRDTDVTVPEGPPAVAGDDESFNGNVENIGREEGHGNVENIGREEGHGNVENIGREKGHGNVENIGREEGHGNVENIGREEGHGNVENIGPEEGHQAADVDMPADINTERDSQDIAGQDNDMDENVVQNRDQDGRWHIPEFAQNGPMMVQVGAVVVVCIILVMVFPCHRQGHTEGSRKNHTEPSDLQLRMMHLMERNATLNSEIEKAEKEIARKQDELQVLEARRRHLFMKARRTWMDLNAQEMVVEVSKQGQDSYIFHDTAEVAELQSMYGLDLLSSGIATDYMPVMSYVETINFIKKIQKNLAEVVKVLLQERQNSESVLLENESLKERLKADPQIQINGRTDLAYWMRMARNCKDDSMTSREQIAVYELGVFNEKLHFMEDRLKSAEEDVTAVVGINDQLVRQMKSLQGDLDTCNVELTKQRYTDQESVCSSTQKKQNFEYRKLERKLEETEKLHAQCKYNVGQANSEIKEKEVIIANQKAQIGELTSRLSECQSTHAHWAACQALMSEIYEKQYDNMNAGWSEIKGALTEFAKNYFPRDMYEVFKENGMFATEEQPAAGTPDEETVDDMPFSETGSENSQDKSEDNAKMGNQDNYREKKTGGSFVDSVFSVMNRTRGQLQETWEQVKNMSDGLWQKHSPSLKRLGNSFSEKFQSLSNKFQQKVNTKLNKWFNKSQAKAEKQHMKREKRENKKEKKREKEENRREKKKEKEEKKKEKKREKENKKQERNSAKRETVKTKRREFNDIGKEIRDVKETIRSISNRISKLDLKEFEKQKTNETFIASVVEPLQKVEDSPLFTDLQPAFQSWVSCQTDWWYSVSVVDECWQELYCWQVRSSLGETCDIKEKDWEQCGWLEMCLRHGKSLQDRGTMSNEQQPNKQGNGDSGHNRQNRKTRMHDESHFPDKSDDVRDEDDEEQEYDLDSDWLWERAAERDYVRQEPDTWFFQRHRDREAKRFYNSDFTKYSEFAKVIEEYWHLRRTEL